MGRRLAVYSPWLGSPSESFIRRHVCDLMPGETVVISDRVFPGGPHWTPTGTSLVLGSASAQPISLATSTALGLLRQPSAAPGLLHHPRASVKRLLVSQFLRRNRVEVMMGEYLAPSLQWLELAQSLGIEFFARALGFDVSRLLRDPRWRQEYLRYGDAAGVIPNSQMGAARLIELGLDPSKVHVVPCGVDVPAAFRSRPERERLRWLAVGRMVPKKAPILLLDSFRRALAECPNITLDYVGDGALMPAAREYVRARGLEGSVQLLGYQPFHVVDRMMRDADAFVQHSVVDPDTGDEEGLPVAILQAMAEGMPVVSTLHAGIPEAVVDGETGFLVLEADISGMAERMAELSQSHEMRVRMGEAGWSRALSRFTWEHERRELCRLMNLRCSAGPESTLRGAGAGGDGSG